MDCASRGLSAPCGERPVMAVFSHLIGAAAAVAAMQAVAPPAVPPEIAPHIPKNLRPYFLVFLVNAGSPKPMAQELFVRHQAYIRQQVEAGTFRLVGPITDGGRLRGMMIVNAAS